MYIFYYYVLIRLLLYVLNAPPLEFTYYIQVDEVLLHSKKRNIVVSNSMTWTNLFMLLILFCFYPIKIKYEEV